MDRSFQVVHGACVTPGPAKRFDPDVALEQARDLFWRQGYAGTSIADLQGELGLGRQSLYDTFGGKRGLFLRALGHYADTVIAAICNGLEDPRSGPLENVERVLLKLGAHHASAGSRGCLLGVTMGQSGTDDEELAGLLRSYLGRLERAFERAIRAGLQDGSVADGVKPKDAARHLVALTQGMALLGRVQDDATLQRSIVRSALAALRA